TVRGSLPIQATRRNAVRAVQPELHRYAHSRERAVEAQRPVASKLIECHPERGEGSAVLLRLGGEATTRDRQETGTRIQPRLTDPTDVRLSGISPRCHSPFFGSIRRFWLDPCQIVASFPANLARLGSTTRDDVELNPRTADPSLRSG